jgi:hypothetical protein
MNQMTLTTHGMEASYRRLEGLLADTQPGVRA